MPPTVGRCLCVRAFLIFGMVKGTHRGGSGGGHMEAQNYVNEAIKARGMRQYVRRS